MDVFNYVNTYPSQDYEITIIKMGLMIHLRDLLANLEADEDSSD